LKYLITSCYVGEGEIEASHRGYIVMREGEIEASHRGYVVMGR